MNIETDLVNDEQKKKQNTRGKDIDDDDVNSIWISNKCQFKLVERDAGMTSSDGDGAPEDDILAEAFAMVGFQGIGPSTRCVSVLRH